MIATFQLLTACLWAMSLNDYAAPLSRMLAVFGVCGPSTVPSFLARGCSLSGPQLYCSPAVVCVCVCVFFHGHPHFRNFNSIIPVDIIIRVKSMWMLLS